MGITARQFEQMQERVNGAKRSAHTRAPAAPPAKVHQVILGIDPSLRGTGYGVIRLAKPNPIPLTYGAISISSTWERSRCLVRIHQTLREVIAEHQPTACAMEGLFYAQNLQTALIMGEARGASLVAAAEAGLEIFEIAPRKMKQAIVGYGAAQKSAVAKMVQRLLQLAEEPDPDAADALALALTFAHETNRFAISPPKRV
jgi:crossover junction endodeoxyribonuclease RuvC